MHANMIPESKSSEKNPDIWKSGYVEIRISGFPEIRKSGNPDFRISRFPEILISGNRDFRKSGHPVCPGRFFSSVGGSTHGEMETNRSLNHPALFSQRKTESERTSRKREREREKICIKEGLETQTELDRERQT